MNIAVLHFLGTVVYIRGWSRELLFIRGWRMGLHGWDMWLFCVI
jgi:hypothetical protein